MSQGDEDVELFWLLFAFSRDGHRDTEDGMTSDLHVLLEILSAERDFAPAAKVSACLTLAHVTA